MVVTYKNELAAQANMQTLRKLDRDWIVDIHDAVAVARDAEAAPPGQLQTKQQGGRGGVC